MPHNITFIQLTPLTPLLSHTAFDMSGVRYIMLLSSLKKNNMALQNPQETSEACRVIGENFRILRQNKGLTFSQLEGTTGLHRPHLSRIEHGTLNIRVSTLEVLATALDVPAHALLIDGYAARLFK
jgi:hypothetical protein